MGTGSEQPGQEGQGRAEAGGERGPRPQRMERRLCERSEHGWRPLERQCVTPHLRGNFHTGMDGVRAEAGGVRRPVTL